MIFKIKLKVLSTKKKISSFLLLKITIIVLMLMLKINKFFIFSFILFIILFICVIICTQSNKG